MTRDITHYKLVIARGDSRIYCELLRAITRVVRKCLCIIACHLEPVMGIIHSLFCLGPGQPDIESAHHKNIGLHVVQNKLDNMPLS